MEIFDFEKPEEIEDIHRQIFALESSLEMLDIIVKDKDLSRMEEDYLFHAKEDYSKIIFKYLPEEVNVIQLGLAGWALKEGAEEKDMAKAWGRKDIEYYITCLKDEDGEEGISDED